MQPTHWAGTTLSLKFSDSLGDRTQRSSQVIIQQSKRKGTEINKPAST